MLPRHPLERRAPLRNTLAHALDSNDDCYEHSANINTHPLHRPEQRGAHSAWLRALQLGSRPGARSFLRRQNNATNIVAMHTRDIGRPHLPAALRIARIVLHEHHHQAAGVPWTTTTRRRGRVHRQHPAPRRHRERHGPAPLDDDAGLHDARLTP
ncbi:hypothetical protein BJ912DRAFT_984914, partial [Pholiota molesta]